MSSLESEFEALLDEESSAYVMVVFNMAQELVQNKDGKEAQALNIIVGSSFALLHAIQNYKEIKDGKIVGYSC